MEHDKSAFLGKDPVFPLLVKMSLPAVVGMFVNAAYNIVDTIFVGRGAGPRAIAGLTVAFPIQMIAGSCALMLGIGAASIVSRRLGEKRKDLAEDAVGTAFAAILIAAVLMTVLTDVLADPMLRLFGATPEILPHAAAYLTTVLWGFPFIAVSLGGNHLIRAEGNPTVAMATMLIGMVLNIVLDPVFIFTLGMGIRGAALATVISQAVSFLWIVLHYLGGRSTVRFHAHRLRIAWTPFREMIFLGLPHFLHMTGMHVVVLVMNNTLAGLGGALAIATYGMAARLLSVVHMPLIGLSQGFQPIAGYNYGARRYDRVRKVLLMAFLSALAVSTVSYAVIMSVPGFLIGMFTTDASLVSVSAPALRTIALLVPLAGIQMIGAGYFQATGKAVPAMLLGLSRQFIVLLPMVLILPRIFGLRGAWAAFPSSDLISTTVTVTALSFELRRLADRHEESLRTAAAG